MQEFYANGFEVCSKFLKLYVEKSGHFLIMKAESFHGLKIQNHASYASVVCFLLTQFFLR